VGSPAGMVDAGDISIRVDTAYAEGGRAKGDLCSGICRISLAGGTRDRVAGYKWARSMSDRVYISSQRGPPFN
jgi:hypothetical protein